MKKRILFFLCALLTLLPLSATAESLPEVLGAVSQGLSEGLKEGMQQLNAAGQDLSLTLTAKDARLEEGQTMQLTLTAGNPYPQPADVTFTLELPDRLSCAQPLTWQAQLEAAKTNPETGELVPSVAVFTRVVTLTPDSGDGEQIELLAEMGMGARFYRAKTALELCVPRISISAALNGAQDSRIEPGDAFALDIAVTNDGTAPKDTTLSYRLPDGVSPAGELPAGFSLTNRTIAGSVRAEAASSVSVRLPLMIDADALDGDADASRLIGGMLTVDGKRVDSPMLHVVGPMISAKLIPAQTSLEEGEMMDMTITVVNSGLAEADVELSCLLPQGLSVVDTPAEKAKAKDTQDAATDGESGEQIPPIAAPEDGGLPPSPDAQAVMSESILRPETRAEDGALIYRLHMNAATQTDSGVAAASKEIRLRVRADVPTQDTGDRLMGTTLAWRTDDGDAHLSEAAALRVHGEGFMGLSSGEWNGILLAALLMMVTVCCLYSAVKADDKEDYCFE